MKDCLLSTINCILSNVTHNKRVFQKWFVVQSKWITSFIQRGENSGLGTKKRRLNRNIRTLDCIGFVLDLHWDLHWVCIGFCIGVCIGVCIRFALGLHWVCIGFILHIESFHCIGLIV